MSRVYWSPDEEFNSGTEELLFTHVPEENYYGEVETDTYRLLKRKPDDYMWGEAVEGRIEHHPGRRVTAEPKRLSGPPEEETHLLSPPEGTQIYRGVRGGFRHPRGSEDPRWELAQSFEFIEPDRYDPSLGNAFQDLQTSGTGIGVYERQPQAVVDYLKAYKGQELPAMSVLGAMLQRHEEMHGTEIVPSTDLSPYSARIVRNLQRRGLVAPNAVNDPTNRMGLMSMRYETYPEEIEESAAIDRVDPAELRSGRKYLTNLLREADEQTPETPTWNDRREGSD